MTDIVEWLLLAGTSEGLHHKAAAEITQLRAELEQERELADRLADTLGAFVSKYGGRNAARQLKDYRDHCATRRNK